MKQPHFRVSKSSIRPMSLADREAAWATHIAALEGGRLRRMAGPRVLSAARWDTRAATVRDVVARRTTR